MQTIQVFGGVTNAGFERIQWWKVGWDKIIITEVYSRKQRTINFHLKFFVKIKLEHNCVVLREFLLVLLCIPDQLREDLDRLLLVKLNVLFWSIIWLPLSIDLRTCINCCFEIFQFLQINWLEVKVGHPWYSRRIMDANHIKESHWKKNKCERSTLLEHFAHNTISRLVGGLKPQCHQVLILQSCSVEKFKFQLFYQCRQ